MKTQQGFLIPLIIIIVAALGIGGSVYYSHKAKQNADAKVSAENSTGVNADGTTPASTIDANANASANANLNTGTSIKGSIKTTATLQELLALNKGKTMMCTGTSSSNGVTTNATTYIDGTTIRADSTTTAKGTVTTGGVILKDNELYSWVGSQGTKMKLNASFDLNAVLGQVSHAATAAKADYSCTPWIVDSSKFTTPSSVTFTDYGSVTMPAITPEMIQKMMKGH